MVILVISPKNKTVYNFRGDLIRDMVANNNTVYVTGPNMEYYDRIMDLGVSGFFKVPFVKDKTNVFSDIRYMLLLKKIIKTINPDMVFSYNIKPVIYGSIAAKISHVPNIFSLVAGLGRVYGKKTLKTRVLKKVTNALYRLSFRYNAKVFFQNENDVDEMVCHHCIKKEKAVLINGSGVNMKLFHSDKYPSQITFLMVGRIIKEKGVIEYCKAASKIKEYDASVRCILLGGYDKSIGSIHPDDIQQFVDSGAVEFPGESDDPIRYYQESSVFVLPSYYREGLPRTILEAMACGRPIITTDWPGCREPIIDSINGFLVPTNDSEALYNKMKLFVDNHDLVFEMGHSSYEICKKKYDVVIINNQMRKVLGY